MTYLKGVEHAALTAVRDWAADRGGYYNGPYVEVYLRIAAALNAMERDKA